MQQAVDSKDIGQNEQIDVGEAQKPDERSSGGKYKAILISEQVGLSQDRRADQVLEQYKLYLEMADRISTRRQSANSFFLSINTALVALTSYLALGETEGGGGWLIAASGMVLCHMWYRLVRSYRDLNGAKFKVVHEIERHLPLAPYDAEWEAVGRGEVPDLYLPFTHVEIRVPWVFFAIHAIVLIRCIPFPLIEWLRWLR